MFRNQRTIQETVFFEGIGLHTGQRCKVVLSPAPPRTGLRFLAVNGRTSRPIPARLEAVAGTTLATSIGRGRHRIQTVEHLLAALVGLNIDNLSISVQGSEIPVMDGSARPFVELLRTAGVVEQPVPQPYLRVLRPFALEEEGRFIRVRPSDTLTVEYQIDFQHPLLRRQKYIYRASEDVFVREIAQARTFGFLRDVARMWTQGLARGGSLKNAIVVDEHRVLNEEGLRYEDEFVRHKVLDFLGDLALVGMPVIGHFTVQKSGHDLNVRFLTQWLHQSDAWEMVTPANGHSAPFSQEAIPLPR